jgi:hypothetical protein
LKIDLREISVHWLTTTAAVDRHKKVNALLDRLEFKKAECIIGADCIPDVQWRGQNKDLAIAQGWIKSLDRPTPFIIFEDDIMETEHWTPIIDVPTCDAIYLGNTHFGVRHPETIPQVWRHPPESHNGLIAADPLTLSFPVRRTAVTSVYNNDLLRVYNMTSNHAILYLDDSYVASCINNLENYIKDRHHIRAEARPDEILAYHMKDHQVLTVRKPFFFQDDGKNTDCTSEELIPIF